MGTSVDLHLCTLCKMHVCVALMREGTLLNDPNAALLTGSRAAGMPTMDDTQEAGGKATLKSEEVVEYCQLHAVPHAMPQLKRPALPSTSSKAGLREAVLIQYVLCTSVCTTRFNGTIQIHYSSQQVAPLQRTDATDGFALCFPLYST